MLTVRHEQFAPELTEIRTPQRRDLFGLSGNKSAIDSAPVKENIGSMKVKTSITLSEELLEAIDRHSRQDKKTRSDFIEVAMWAFIAQAIRKE
jgi:hypothetical protein